MAKITWANKNNFIDDSTIPASKKISASDMNQIKSVVNQTVDDLGTKQNSIVRGTFTGDLNECKEVGLYWANFTNVTNAPYTSGYGFVDVKASSSNAFVQEIYRHTSNGVSEKKVRQCINSQWHPWIKIDLVEKQYTSSNSATGTTVNVIVKDKIAGIRIRGTVPKAIATQSGYITVGTVSALSSLITKGNVIKYAVLGKLLFGQIRIEAGTGNIGIGYTYNSAGETINVPANQGLYIDETIFLQ